MPTRPRPHRAQHVDPPGVRATRGTPDPTQQLNESFKLNLYRYGEHASHNVDFDFAYQFFYDMAAAATNEATLMATCMVMCARHRRSSFSMP